MQVLDSNRLDLGRFRVIVLAIAGFLAFIAAILALNFQLAGRFAADAGSVGALVHSVSAEPFRLEMDRVQAGMASRAHEIQIIQLVGILGAAGLFIGILFYFFRNVRREELLAGQARKETSDILHTVNEGLFLLDRNLQIGSERSQALADIFHRGDFAGMSFDVLLRDIVPEKTLVTALDYVNLLWGERVNEKLVKTINPLSEVEVHFQNPAGGYDTHFLEFDFNRVKAEGALSHLLVTVNDVTKRVMLARELLESQEKSQAQMDLLLRILHLDPATVTSFLGDSDVSLKIINTILREPAREEAAFRRKIDGMFRQAHAIKGEAASLGLKTVEERAHAFEESLNDLKTRPELSGSDFLPLVVKLDELMSHLAQIREMLVRLVDLRHAISEQALTAGPAAVTATSVAATQPASAAGVRPSSAAATFATAVSVAAQRDDVPHRGGDFSEPADGSGDVLSKAHEDQLLTESTILRRAEGTGLEQALQNLVQRLADSQAKRAELKLNGLEAVPEHYRRPIKDIAIQLVRNAMVHGIETPAERRAARKTESGLLSVDFADKGAEGFELVVQDDGRGLLLDKIKDVAVKSGLIAPEQAAVLDSRQTMALIFRPGFSTSDEVTADAGRGAGMDLVRASVADLGGRIGMSSAGGRFAKFKVWLPATAHVAAA